MDNFINKIFDKLWPKPICAVYYCLLSFIFGLVFLPKNDDDSKLALYLYLSASIFIFFLIVIMLIKANKLPKARKDAIAILFRVDTETNKQFEEIKRKFIEEFANLLNSHTTSSFHTLYIPRSRIQSVYNKDEKEILLKTRCTFLISIRLLTNDMDNPDQYKMSIKCSLIHNKYKDSITKKLHHEFDSLTGLTSIIHYSKQLALTAIELVSEQLSYICKYFFGLTFYLNGQEIKASVICEELNTCINNIKKEEQNNPIIKYLKSNLPKLNFEINYIASSRFYKKYKSDYSKADLDQSYSYLLKANNYIRNTYSYYLQMSVFHFLRGRNIKESRGCIEECRKTLKNHVWRYSDAFLAAYEGKSLLSVYRKYRIAFRIDYDLIEIATFIEHVLEVEPDKTSLHFALGLVYQQIGDLELMKYHLNKFSIKIDYFSKTKELHTILSSLINTDNNDNPDCSSIDNS